MALRRQDAEISPHQRKATCRLNADSIITVKGERLCVGMVVGSVTGLTAARQLRLRGHEVIVFDEVNDFDAVLAAIAKGM
ncbi:MAG: hypothetical protein IJQ82_03430 [Selenomonadaceae bacterium]|nr:hypothetical protein [Selenomonadaceae bacterium]